MVSSITLTIPQTTKPDWTVNVVAPEPEQPTAQAADPAIAVGELDEPSLVAACLDGTPGAFDLMVERHRRPVYQLCYRFCGNHEDASDCTQEVFLRAYRGLKSFRGQSSIATWLYRIAVNLSLNRAGARKLATEPIDVREHIDRRADSPAEQMLRQEQVARVREAITLLPRKQKAVLVLRMYQELSHQEIAAIVGTSVGAVKANVFHALRNLKKILGEESR